MPYNFREIEAKLKKIGYTIVRQKGSHVIFSNYKNTFPVPKHATRDISPWVEAKIIKIIWLSKEEFRDL